MYQKVIIEFDKLQISIIKSEISPFYLYLDNIEKKSTKSIYQTIHYYHQFTIIIINSIPSNSPLQESTQHRTRVQRIKIDSNYSLSIHA